MTIQEFKKQALGLLFSIRNSFGGSRDQKKVCDELRKRIDSLPDELEPSKDLDKVVKKIAVEAEGLLAPFGLPSGEKYKNCVQQLIDEIKRILTDSGLVMAVRFRCLTCGSGLYPVDGEPLDSAFDSLLFNIERKRDSIFRCLGGCKTLHRVTLTPTAITAIERTGG